MKSNILPIILFLVLTLVLSVLNPLLLVFAILGLAVGYLLSRIVGERLVGKEGGQAKHAMVNTEAKTESGEAKAVERPDDAEVEQVTENISGFTLVELLVVVAIIAILAAIIFPMFAKTREKAYQSQCSNHLRQLGVALQTYIQDNGERLPSHENWIAATGIKKVDNEILHCPSDLRNATEAGSDMNQELDIIVSYDMNPYISGKLMADIEDQTSTALVRDCENGKLSPRHSGHVNTCFVDGHVSRVYQDTIKFKGELISTIKIEQRSRYSVDETISFSDLTPLRNCYERLLSPEELNALQQDRTRQDLLKTMIRNLMSENWKVELGAIPSSGSCLLQNATISRHLEGRIGNNQWDYDSPVAAEVVWSRSYMDYTYHSPVTKFPDIVLVYNTDKSKIHVEMPPYSFKGASQSSVETVTNPTKNERGNPIDKCVVKLPPPGKLLYLSCWRYLPALFHNPFINTLFIQLIKKPFLYIIGVIGLVFSENFRKFILLPIATKLWNLFLRIFKLQTMGT